MARQRYVRCNGCEIELYYGDESYEQSEAYEVDYVVLCPECAWEKIQKKYYKKLEVTNG